MQCYSPLKGYRAVAGGGIAFSPRTGFKDKHLTLRCGQCIGCRLDYARIWGIRAFHEASMHEKNIFATFTYDDDHLPYHDTLVRADFQKFIKRLRKKVPNKFRIFYCGEYGRDTFRPHYHSLIFGYAPSDPVSVAEIGGQTLYTSKILTDTWKLGKVDYYDQITFTSAAYVAGYVTKKINGARADAHYERIDSETGEVYQLLPEFSGQSLRPGIGQPWIQQWGLDVYAKDEIIIEGKAMRPPRYYDEVFAKLRPNLWRKVSQKRALASYRELKKEGDKFGYLDADQQTYKDTDRQSFVAQKITLSKQKKRS